METLKKLTQSLNLDNKQGYAASILIALIIVSFFAASYYVLLKPPEKGYTTIAVLDAQRQAIDYPELLVINQNSTLNVFVEVENQMNASQSCTVMQKTTTEMIQKLPLAADANANYTKLLEKGGAWEIPVAVTINKPGNYSVIFELWLNDATGALYFSENACVLNVEVVNQA